MGVILTMKSPNSTPSRTSTLHALLHTIAAVVLLHPLSSFGQGSQLPFDRGVKIEVIASKPAPIRGGDWDDKTQRISLRLKFSNIHNRQSYEGCTATVSALGQSAVDRNIGYVFLQERIALSLVPLSSLEHTCKEIITRFDKTVGKFGYFYDGWVIVVTDPAGKVLHVKSTSSSMEKAADKVQKLQAGKYYDRNLDVIETRLSYFGR